MSMSPARIPALDFAFFPMSSKENGALLGWEVTMLDVDLFRDASKLALEQHAQSMPLLIGEVTELLEGPVLKLVVKRRLKLWLPVAYSAFGDDVWVNGLVEQLSGPAALRRGVALVVRWRDLPPALLELRPNVDRLRVIGLRAVDTSHAVMALTYDGDDEATADDRFAVRRNPPIAANSAGSVHEVNFGAAVSLASVLRQLR